MKSFIAKAVLAATATGAFLFLGIGETNPAHAGQLKGLYVFGDSLVDDGNFYELTNFTFPPSQLGYSQGRFSNGPVFAELLPQKLGFNYNSNNNFAIGGAGAGNYHPSGLAGLGLESQIGNYLDTVKKADKKALYLISAGSNDYSTLDPTDGIINDVQPVVDNLIDAVTRLADAKAKNFMVVGVPDFGIIPVNVNYPHENPEAALSLLTNVANLHNQLLVESLSTLNDQFKVNITFFDLNPALYAAVEPNNPFGFNNVTDGCLDISIEALSAGQLPANPPCSNPSKYLFWDWSHPTAAGHELLADYAVEALEEKTDKIKKNKIKDQKTQQKVDNLAQFGASFSTIESRKVPESTNILSLLALGVFGVSSALQRIRK